MKLFKASLLLVALFTVAGVCRADVVAVSSFTATRIGRGDGTRKHMILQNSGSGPIYLAFTPSSATVNGGFVLNVATWTTTSRVTLEDFSGNVYGLASPGAAGEVRKLEVPK